MNILQINKFFYIRGGAARYFFEVSKLLRLHKHRVALFSMQDEKNYKTRWSKYFVSNVNFHDFNPQNIPRILGRMFYSFEARNKLDGLLRIFDADIAHLHSIYHQLSPSIIFELHKRNIPIVQTVHDYHLVSLNYNLFHNGKICEITKPNKYYKAIFHKCVKNSYFATFVEVIEKYIYYYLGWGRHFVDYFIAPSKFMEKKLLEYEIPSRKIIYLPLYLSYFVDPRQYQQSDQSGDYILYFGRLSEEKGLDFLLDVMSILPNIKLIIVGRGREENNLRMKIAKLKLHNVELLGFKDGVILKKIIGGSRFTVLPSLWYDVAPLSILESFASGKPVIASNIGGIPEMVKDGYNGYLFKPGNREDCQDKIIKLWDSPLLCRKMGKNAREFVEKNFGPEEHYEKLIQIYETAISKHR